MTDLHYCMEIDYDRTNCTGECEDICRCTEIYNTRITEINYSDVVRELIFAYQNSIKDTLSDFLSAIFERLCRIYGAYNPNNYDVNIVDGYYGQEIGSVNFMYENEVREEFAHICDIQDDVDKVKYILEKEYGHITDKVANATKVTMRNCDISRIKIPQETHFKQVCGRISDYHSSGYSYIIVDNMYGIIDGYHRFAEAIVNNRSTIHTIILT